MDSKDFGIHSDTQCPICFPKSKRNLAQHVEYRTPSMKTLKRSFISIPYEPRSSQDPRCAGLAQHFQGVQVAYGGLQNLGVSATKHPQRLSWTRFTASEHSSWQMFPKCDSTCSATIEWTTWVNTHRGL